MKPWLMFVPWMWVSHLLGAVWLSAGVLSGVVLFSLLKRTDADPAGRVFGLRLAWRLMAVFLVPGVLITGALGFYLVTVPGFGPGWGKGWVQASLALYLILLASTLFVQVPQLRKALRAAEAGRMESTKLAGILSHVNATIILILILLMAFATKSWLMLVSWMRFSHLLGALWLSAGVLSGVVLFSLLKRADADPAGRVFGLRLAWRLMVIFMVPGVIITGALGFYLVTLPGIGWGKGWVQVSLLLYLILLATTLFVQVPQLRKALRAAEAGRLEPSKLAGILHHVHSTIIVVLILLMAFKPF